MVRPARAADLAAVVSIARRRALGEMENRRASANGFLVSSYNEADYKDLLTRANQFLVAEEYHQILGFVIAYGSETLQPTEWLNLRVREELPNFLVVKQIATDVEQAGRGIGTRLYEAVLARTFDRPVIAAVVTDPENKPSEALHRALGFVPYRSLVPPDGLPRMVWIYPAPTAQ